MADEKKYSKEQLDKIENDMKDKYRYDELSDADKAKFDGEIEKMRNKYQKDDDTDNTDKTDKVDNKKDDDPYKEELQRERKKEIKTEEDKHEKEDEHEHFL